MTPYQTPPPLSEVPGLVAELAAVEERIERLAARRRAIRSDLRGALGSKRRLLEGDGWKLTWIYSPEYLRVDWLALCMDPEFPAVLLDRYSSGPHERRQLRVTTTPSGQPGKAEEIDAK